MSYSILIVDDSLLVRHTLRACFERSAEWTVCGEAGDGLEAIEKARQLRPDLIILDMSMPGMNGLDVARELKIAMPSVRLLMFTSFKSPTLEREAVAAGCTALVGNRRRNCCSARSVAS